MTALGTSATITTSSHNMEEFDKNTGASVEEQLVSKKKTNGSVIWRWFEFKSSDEQQNSAFCRKCGALVQTSRQRGTQEDPTMSLFHHLQQHHAAEYDECVKLVAVVPMVNTSQPHPMKQTTARSPCRAAPYERTSERWRDISKAVAYRIAKDMLPVSTVEQDGFVQLLKVLDPRYTLPSRSYFSRRVLPEMYAEVREGVAARLATASHFALSTDTWSSASCEPYMSVTVHFIQDWELRRACLQTSYIPQEHTGEHVASALQDVLTDWKLDPAGLVAITADDGAETVKAARLKEWPRMQCLGHSLHQAIGRSLDDARITQAVSLCKKIVSIFSYSSKKRRELAEVLMQMGLPGQKLVTESATSWLSRLLMIERVLEQETALSKVLSADKKTRRLVPTCQDIEVLEAVAQALEPLENFAGAFSSEEYVTLSYVRPVLHMFNTSLLAPAEGDDELCKSIKTSIVDYLNDKFADPSISDLLDIASFVDPRFKFKYTPGDKMDALKQKVILEMESLMPKPAELESADQKEAAGPHIPKRWRSLGSFLQDETATITCTQEAIGKELSSYLLVCVEYEADPLRWWKEHEVVYPTLSQLAKKYLCVQANSFPPEMLCSCGGNVNDAGVTCQSASLRPGSVDRSVFLAHNL